MTLEDIKSPAYVLEEKLLRRNLELINRVSKEANIEIILAFKAYALWKTFPIFREYIQHSTASSIYEARLGFEEMGAKVHTFSPAYTLDDIDEYTKYSSHISINSISQYNTLRDKILSDRETKWGYRINPGYSPVQTEKYNPSMPGSRYGLRAKDLENAPMDNISGFHFHVFSESTADELEIALNILERDFSKYLDKVEWLNMGGGHLMTHKDYDVNKLISLLRAFGERHPNLKIILEPGSAFAWQTGFLRSKVVDIVEHEGIKTAILNVSFTCHMPDTLEMPYQPLVRGAERMEDNPQNLDAKFVYRFGGNSCLSGDWIGDWVFDHKLEIGEEIILEDMIHYTTVKTTMFNGISHPMILMQKLDGSIEVLREFDYSDYKTRMD